MKIEKFSLRNQQKRKVNPINHKKQKKNKNFSTHKKKDSHFLFFLLSFVALDKGLIIKYLGFLIILLFRLENDIKVYNMTIVYQQQTMK